MDYLPQEYSCFGNGDFRSPAFQMRDENGVFGVDLRCKSRKRYEGKYVIQGLPAVYAAKEEAYTEEVLLEDKASGVEVTLRYGVLPELDVITRSVEVRNNGSRKVFLNKVCSVSMDFLTVDFDLLHFYGRHTMERNVERIPVVHGNQGFGSRRGTSSHQHNPFVIFGRQRDYRRPWKLLGNVASLQRQFLV